MTASTLAPSSQSSTSASPRSYEVAADGQVRAMASPTATLMRRFPQRKSYRLYRFLSDLDDLVAAVRSDRDRLRIATVLVRRLLERSPWIVNTCPQPDPDLGWGVHFLYDEPGYPFTIQTVSWLPGQTSPIHNHGGWSLVAIIGDPARSGRERNRLWHRQDDGSQAGYGQITQISEVILQPGDMVGFTPEAIHDVCALPASETAPQPTLTFNIYGETDFKNRYEFDPEQNTAVLF